MNQPVIKNSYDSEFCGNLPIHLINVIQPYGVLIVVEKDGLKFLQVSENAGKVFRVQKEQLLAARLDQYLNESSLALLQQKFSGGINENIPMVWDIEGTRYLVIAHYRDPFYTIEINLD